MSNTAILIKEMRISQGLTLRQLAEKSGVTAAHLSRIETGKTNASMDTLVKVANGLGVKVTDLQFESENVNDLVSQIVDLTMNKEINCIIDLVSIVNERYCENPHDLSKLDGEMINDIRGLMIDLIKNRLNHHIK